MQVSVRNVARKLRKRGLPTGTSVCVLASFKYENRWRSKAIGLSL